MKRNFLLILLCQYGSSYINNSTDLKPILVGDITIHLVDRPVEYYNITNDNTDIIVCVSLPYEYCNKRHTFLTMYKYKC